MTDTLAVPTSVAPPPTDAAPVQTLALCSEVPVIETAVVGDDPSGGSLDPVLHAVLLTYARDHESTFGGMWLDREANGTMVLAFTDDPVAHRKALSLRRPTVDDVPAVQPMPAITDDRPIGEWGVAVDVVQVAFTEADLRATSERIARTMNEAGLKSFGVGSDIMRNRVSVHPAEAPTAEDATAMAQVIQTVAPLDMVCLEGSIVDVRPDPIVPGSPLDVIVLPDEAGTYPPDTEVECGGVRFTLGDLQSMTPVEDADPGLQAVLEGWIDGPEGGRWPGDQWVVLVQTEERATLVRIADDGMLVVGAEMGRNGWIWAGASGAGACDVKRRLPDGLGDVGWELDPAHPMPDPATTELHVLATERACTGASEMGDRLLGPQVVETDDAVRIVFAAIPLTGAQRCPGNPPAPVTITLERPLGDRTIVDGLRIAPLRDLLP